MEDCQQQLNDKTKEQLTIVNSHLKNFKKLRKSLNDNNSNQIGDGGIPLRKYKGRDTELDELKKKIIEIKNKKEKITDKLTHSKKKKIYNYELLIKKFHKVNTKPLKMKKKKISSNIINESDYSDNSINYSVLNLKEDNNHSEDNLKSIRKMLGDKSKLVEENNNKLKLILKQDIEGILIVMDDLNLDDKE